MLAHRLYCCSPAHCSCTLALVCMFTGQKTPVALHKPLHPKCLPQSTGASQYPHSHPVGGSNRTMASHPVHSSCCLDRIHTVPQWVLMIELLCLSSYQSFQIYKNSPHLQRFAGLGPGYLAHGQLLVPLYCSHKSVHRNMSKYVYDGSHMC